MAWNYNGYGNGFANAPRQSGYSRGYSRNYNNGGNYNRQPKKRSGSKSGVGKSNAPYVTGWNASKSHGLVSFLCTPYKGTSVHESRSGRRWENWVCKVTPKMAKPFLVSCLYDANSRKVIIGDLGIVINPSAPNGGYCGRFGKK